MRDATGTGRTVGGDSDRAALDYDPLILHCPTGHLSAAVAGIALGHLPAGPPPDCRTLRRFFARELRTREPGAIVSMTPASGRAGQASAAAAGSVFCLVRGWASELVETALVEVARVAGRRVIVQPAIRAARARPGRGQNPTPPRKTPDPALCLSSLLAGLLDRVSLHRLADLVMAGQVRRLYPELVRRAAGLPGPALRRRPPAGPPSDAPAVRVIYHCFGAAHTSVTAAALHCRDLPAHGRVTLGEVLRLPGFDRRDCGDIGGAFYYGGDSRACEVYVIGFDGSRRVIARASDELLARLPGTGERVVLAGTLPAASTLVKIGGYSSRRLGLIRLGRPLAAMGTVLSIPALRRTVGAAKAEVARLLGEPAES